MKYSKLKTISNASAIVFLVVGLMTGGQALAASACKGLDNKACDAKADCSWVNGYERKDGKTVKSFCRSKAKKKAKADAKKS